VIAFPALSAPVRGASWMLFSAFCYVISAILARHLGDGYSSFQIAFIRSVIAVIMIAPILIGAGIRAFHTKQFGLHVLTTLFTYTAIIFWLYGATRMPVAEFFALQFTTPLFTISLAVLLLRERVSTANWIATLAGFAGVLVILRPGVMEVTLGALATLACAVGYASVNTIIKVVTRTESSLVIVFYVNLLMVPLSLPMAVLRWRTPDWNDTWLIAGIAVFSTVAFLAVARAISIAAARVVQPISFLRMPIAAVSGLIFFSEFPDLWTWAGAIIIFGSAYYVVTRETGPKEG
jgi:drug/metabolite transporter (DMT)-like permease